MTKYEFVKRFLPEAEAAEKRFHLNPVVMLAQAAIESGWNWSRADCLPQVFRYAE